MVINVGASHVDSDRVFQLITSVPIVQIWYENCYFPLLSFLWVCLGSTYAVHLRLIGKLAVDFPLVIIELFSRCYG